MKSALMRKNETRDVIFNGDPHGKFREDVSYFIESCIDDAVAQGKYRTNVDFLDFMDVSIRYNCCGPNMSQQIAVDIINEVLDEYRRSGFKVILGVESYDKAFNICVNSKVEVDDPCLDGVILDWENVE